MVLLIVSVPCCVSGTARHVLLDRTALYSIAVVMIRETYHKEYNKKMLNMMTIDTNATVIVNMRSVLSNSLESSDSNFYLIIYNIYEYKKKNKRTIGE